jgi:mxaL protein
LPTIQSIIKKFKKNRDLHTLLVTFSLLALALFQPTIPVKHNIYSYFFVIDITQSMNVVDMQIKGKPTSRLNYTKQMLRETISTLPCGTKVGLGMFSGVNVVTLYLPIDVCENFNSIQDTLDHIDWRSAWTADSRVRESMLSTARVVANFTEPAQVVYFSDGEEAPKLHAFNTRDLSTLQSADGWLLVGIGSPTGGAIPRFTEKNQLTGYWSHESMQLAHGAAPIAAAGLLKRKSDIAESVNDRYISKLSEASMQTIAKEIGANYVRGDSLQTLKSAIKKQKPARREWAPFSISLILAALAGLLLLSSYFPSSYFSKNRNKRAAKPQFTSSESMNESLA